MFGGDYLSLRLVRLKSSEEWTSEKEGLCVVLFKEGVGHYSNGSTQQRLVSGDTLVWEANSRARVSANGSAEVTFWWFSLRVDHLFPLFANEEISLLQGMTSVFRSFKLFPAATPLSLKCHRLVDELSPKSDLERRSHLLCVAAAILNEEFRTGLHQRVSTGQVEGRIIHVFEKLSVDELLDLSVVELAAKFGCSRRHLNRLFHHYFGFSVGALRMEMRLLKAVSLLRDANAKVINVAEQCGFNHLGLFNTCFKKRFGVSPGLWRKQQIAPGKTQTGTFPDAESTCPLQVKGLCPLFVGSPANNVRVGPGNFPFKNPPESKTAPDTNADGQAIAHYSPRTVPERATPRP